MTGSVAMIKWGSLRTFTFDIDQQTIQYVESGQGIIDGRTEGRGQARCKVSDARTHSH